MFQLWNSDENWNDVSSMNHGWNMDVNFLIHQWNMDANYPDLSSLTKQCNNNEHFFIISHLVRLKSEFYIFSTSWYFSELQCNFNPGSNWCSIKSINLRLAYLSEVKKITERAKYSFVLDIWIFENALMLNRKTYYGLAQILSRNLRAPYAPNRFQQMNNIWTNQRFSLSKVFGLLAKQSTRLVFNY